MLCEDFDEAQRVFSIALVNAEKAGAATSIVGLGAQKAWMFTRLGRLSEALDLFAASAGLIDVVPFAEGYVLVGQAYVLLLMGKLDESEALCQRAESTGARRGQTNALIFLHEVRGHRALREGRTFDAADQYAALEELVHRTGLREPCLATWARHAVSAHLSCNREPEAQRLVQWIEGCNKGLPCTWPRIAAATGRALLAWHGAAIVLPMQSSRGHFRCTDRASSRLRRRNPCSSTAHFSATLASECVRARSWHAH